MNEALKQEYQEKLGEDFGTVLYQIRNDWQTGLVRLKEYRILFSDYDTVSQLNAIGGAFMWDVQQILWRDLLLHVTRLTDPATMGRHENLSVQALPPFCERPELQVEYPELHEAVQELVARAVTAADGPRDWRNRRISHADLGLAIDSDAESLAPTSLRQVQAALDAVHSVIQTIAGIGERRVGYNPCGECELERCMARILCSMLVDGRPIHKTRAGRGRGSHKGRYYGTGRQDNRPRGGTGGRGAHTGRPEPGAAQDGRRHPCHSAL